MENAGSAQNSTKVHQKRHLLAGFSLVFVLHWRYVQDIWQLLRDGPRDMRHSQIMQAWSDFETIICMPVLFVEFGTAYPQDVGVGVLIPAFHAARVSTDAACSRTSRCF
jgi:hypothetical protein